MSTIEDYVEETTMRRLRQCGKLVLLAYIGLAVAFAGCGGGSMAPSPTPTIQNATVTGQYNLVLTSTNGHGTTNIYTNFSQTGGTLIGAPSTLVCPSNDLSSCQGESSPAGPITPRGTVKGENVSIVISLPGSAGADTVTLVGTAAGTNLSGTYTDSLGDSGLWTAFASGPLSGTFTGTFNSISNPLTITPDISLALTQDASLNLTGSATITSSPCISSLNFSGQAIGGAFTLTDAANKVSIIALPTGSSFNFSYVFDHTAAHCPGDYGRGLVANPNPWDY